MFGSRFFDKLDDLGPSISGGLGIMFGGVVLGLAGFVTGYLTIAIGFILVFVGATRRGYLPKII